VKGVQFVVDGTGRKTAVQIDLKKQRRLWEDLYDRALEKARAVEPRESLESVKKRVQERRQRRRRA
jgi:TolB-like protein